MRRFALLGLLLVPAIVFAFHYDPTKEKPEAKATSTKSAARVVAPFALTDAVNGKSWDWKELKKPRAVVVVFLGTECPINNAYTTRLVELNAKYSKENVVFVGINSNSHDTPIKIAAHAKEHGLTFPVLKDSGNVVADQFGALPHAGSVRRQSRRYGSLSRADRRPGGLQLQALPHRRATILPRRSTKSSPGKP